MKKPSGVILYQGPSLLDGAPIVVIATGLNASSNSKTGDMVQTHIIRADMLPMDAIYNGEDSVVFVVTAFIVVMVRASIEPATSPCTKRRLPFTKRSCVAVTQCTTQLTTTNIYPVALLGSGHTVTQRQRQ
jgi:hypothetical protein